MVGMQRVSKSRVPGRFGYQKSGPGWARVLHFRTRVLAIGYPGTRRVVGCVNFDGSFRILAENGQKFRNFAENSQKFKNLAENSQIFRKFGGK